MGFVRIVLAYNRSDCQETVGNGPIARIVLANQSGGCQDSDGQLNG